MTKPIGTYDYKLKKRFAKRLDKAYQYALNKHLAIRMIREAINENELTGIFLDENITGILKRKKGYLIFEEKTE